MPVLGPIARRALATTTGCMGRRALQLQRYCGISHSSAPAASHAATKDLRVAIIGAGVGGPALALLMKKHLGITPVVFEQAHAIKEVGAGISLAPNGVRALTDTLGGSSCGPAGRTSSSSSSSKEQAGLGSAGIAVGEPIRRMLVTRPDDSLIVNFPTLAEEGYGLPMTGVRRFRLLNLLLGAMSSQGIPLELGKRLAAIEQEEPMNPQQQQQQQQRAQGSGSSRAGRALVRFEDGSSYEADLVVGCDGLRSATRAVVKGSSEAPPTFTNEEVVFAVTCDRNSDLVPPNTCRMVYGPGHQHFGAYGLGQDCSWFTSGRAVTGSRDTWGPVKDASEIEQLKQELADRYRGWGLVQRMLERDVAVMIRVGIFDRETPDSWSRGVVTLAGDAASPIPPNLGQGGNKALEDAAVLVAGLKRHSGDIPAALSLYQQLRSQRSAALLSYSRQAAQVSNLDHPISIAARNSIIRGIVALRGTIPSGWMWAYDAEAAVTAAAAAPAGGARRSSWGK